MKVAEACLQNAISLDFRKSLPHDRRRRQEFIDGIRPASGSRHQGQHGTGWKPIRRTHAKT